MAERKLRWLVRPASFAALLFLLAACAANAPQDYLKPVGDEAVKANRLFQPTFWIAAAVFFLVEGGIVFLAVKFRDRPGRDEPKQIHGNSRLEFTWTLIPAVILAGIAIPTVLTIFSVAAKTAPNEVRIKVTGHQWWWEYRYLNANPAVITANELVMPVGRPIFLELESNDVIHSFWIPKLAGKQDVVPGRTNLLALKSPVTGEFYGQCTEYCGLGHANMRARARVVTEADFDEWIRRQQQPAAEPQTPDQAQGQQIFTSNICITCHTINGIPNATGQVGPNLTHFADRGTFAGSMFENTPANVANWIKHTQELKEGADMPSFGGMLNDEQIRLLVAYLESLR